MNTQTVRQFATEIACQFAKEKPESYYSEPFTPHEWVVDALEYVLKQGNELETHWKAEYAYNITRIAELQKQIEVEHGYFTNQCNITADRDEEIIKLQKQNDVLTIALNDISNMTFDSWSNGAIAKDIADKVLGYC